jgi:hypothetical protein
MSERGSFVTEFIYCSECQEVVRNAFQRAEQGKWFTANQVMMGLYPRPIFAGCIGESWPGGEVFAFETEVLPLLADVCHPVRIVVLPETGDAVTFTAEPQTRENRQ